MDPLPLSQEPSVSSLEAVGAHDLASVALQLERARQTVLLYERAAALLERQVQEASATAEHTLWQAREDAASIVAQARSERDLLRAEVQQLAEERDHLRADLEAQRSVALADIEALKARGQTLLADIQELATRALTTLDEPATSRDTLEHLSGRLLPRSGPGEAWGEASEQGGERPLGRESLPGESLAGPLPDGEALPASPRDTRQAGAVHGGWTAATRFDATLTWLTRGVTLAVLLLVVGLIVPLALGWQLYSLDGASMEPAIPSGSLLLTRPTPPEQVRVSDIITYADSSRGLRVTGRVISITPGSPPVPRTKGDANPAEDVTPFRPGEPIARVEGWVPGLGAPLAALSSPLAKWLLAAVIAGVLLWQFLPRRSV